MFSKCGKCGKKWLWFLVKQRWYTHPIGGQVKSETRYCPKCDSKAKKLFSQMKVDKPKESA